MYKGKVEFFNNKKGWGIIKAYSGETVFIHHNDIKDEKFFPTNKPNRFRTLKPGQEVSFFKHLVEGSKYPVASGLKLS